MNEAEIRVNAMMSEYRQTIIALTDRSVMLAADNATLRAKLEEAAKPKPDNVTPIKELP